MSGAAPESTAPPEFRVNLEVFDGPFDLLLSLISKHELDITEIALSLVTDEFISYVAQLDSAADLSVRRLDQASEFLVVAATLLDLKIARLLPQGEVVDAEAVALLEARDLLFARLLQYRAFKQAASWFRERLAVENARHPRLVPLEPRYRRQRAPLEWRTSLADFAALAALTLTPQEELGVGLDHLHAPAVSIREQAATVVALLRSSGQLSFRDLIAEVTERPVIVARFLAVLELFRRAAVSFEQQAPLGELLVRWSATHWEDTELATLGADYDN